MKRASSDSSEQDRPKKLVRRENSDNSSEGSDGADGGAGRGVRIISGDIDSKVNRVVRTPEAEAQLANIENRIGDFVCRLCRSPFVDAFDLALHSCPRMQHVEYPCPECDKVFNCPANLASHRRWHRPRDTLAPKRKKDAAINPRSPTKNSVFPAAGERAVLADDGSLKFGVASLQCSVCGDKFALPSHLAAHVTHEHAVLFNRFHSIQQHMSTFFEKRFLKT